MANGHGGYRQGAGRKPADYEPTPDQADLAANKARNEAAKADLNELELRIKSGEYVARVAVREETATALSTLAQSLRSVPDNLERKLGVSPEVAEEVGRLIDEALNDVADAFEQLAAEPEQVGDDLVLSSSGADPDVDDLL